MLTNVQVLTQTSMMFNIEAVDPDEILIIKSISGLSSVDLTLFTGDYARDGGYYQGQRANKRNMVLNLKLNPDYANDVEVSDIREMLYLQFAGGVPGSDWLLMMLYDDRKPVRYIRAYTEKIETDLFQRNQTAQVSMICVDPYLSSLIPVSFSNPAGVSSTPIDYDGSAPAGLYVKVEVKVATSVVNITLPGGLNQMITLTKPSGSFNVGDIITINTQAGARYVRVNGVDAMNYLTSTKWPTLNQSSTSLNAYGSVLADGKAVVTDYSYTSQWWGI